MELSSENIKKPRYWLELPLVIGKAVCDEVSLELNYLLGVEPPKAERVQDNGSNL